MTVRRVGIIAALLASLALLLWHVRVYAFLCDDAFISFRYARNLAQGYGLVFNPGFERVEGYTNFLWVVILALGQRLGVAPESLANPLLIVATIALWGLVVWFAWRSRSEGGAWWPAIVPPLMLAATPSIAVWATSGLETRLFEVLVVAATLRLAIEIESDALGSAPRRRFGAFLFALAALTRPDGVMMGCAAIAAGHVFLWTRGRAKARTFLIDVGVPAIVVGSHFLWRRAYYGEWLPNTYYVKAAGRMWWDMGGLYVGAFLLESMALLWIPLVILGVLHRWRRGSAHVPLLFAAVIVPHALYIASLGGDHFEWRPLDLYFPFLFLLAGDGVAALVAPRRPLRAALVGAWVMLALAGLMWLPWRIHHEFPAKYIAGFPGLSHSTADNDRFLDPARDPVLRWPPFRVLARAHRDAIVKLTSRFVGIRQEEHARFFQSVRRQALELQALVRDGLIPRDAHFAMSCVGIIPYVTNLRTLDRFGLTDRVVAHSPAIEGWLMAHDKLATLDYAKSAGVDFWAEDSVRSVLYPSDPELSGLLQRARDAGTEVFFADAGDGVLLGRLPQGRDRAALRFPRLHFESSFDDAAVARLEHRIEESVRAAIVPSSPEGMRLRATDLAARGLNDEAVAILREIEGDDFETAMTLGLVLANSGRFDEARASFLHAAALRPDRFEPLSSLGLLFAKTGDWTSAVDALSRAIAINPANVEDRYTLGVGGIALGNIELARDQARALRENGSPAALRFADRLEHALGDSR